MSYDLMVFHPDLAPRRRTAFMKWYQDQTQWSEEHTYDDPAVTSDNLRSWFVEMIASYPAMNGPYAKEEDEDNDAVTDYAIGKDVIYAAFPWSLAEQAYEKMTNLAQKHRVDFFDVSAADGDILFPDHHGNNVPIDKPDNLSSIQKIKNSVSTGQENKSVREIIYSKVIPRLFNQSSAKPSINTVGKRNWWKKLFRIK